VKRLVNPRDRRYSVIKATPEGRRLAERIASTFEQVRKDLFVGILDDDIQRLGRTLPRMHGNAARISSERGVLAVSKHGGSEKRKTAIASLLLPVSTKKRQQASDCGAWFMRHVKKRETCEARLRRFCESSGNHTNRQSEAFATDNRQTLHRRSRTNRLR